MAKNKNMKLLTSLFKYKEASNKITASTITTTTTTNATLPWQWPLCTNPKTLSFRATDEVFKTINSVFFDHNIYGESDKLASNYCLTNSSELVNISTEFNEHCTMGMESVEMIIRGARSERLFFEPGDTSSILLENANIATTYTEDDNDDADDDNEEDYEGLPFKESVVMAMESEDPYEDFRKSMEEMVESHGLKDWECLEELLGWYLRKNGKKNHELIVGAFVDLLVGLADSCCDSASYSSAASTFSSSSIFPLSPVLSQEIDEDEGKMVIHNTLA